MAEENEIFPTEFTVSEFTCFYYIPYYPIRFKISDNLNEYRKIVFDFKTGRIGEAAGSDFANDIEHLQLKSPLSDWSLCVIPASTSEKTKVRFELFCKSFCQPSLLNNGFEFISDTTNRSEIHLAKDRSSIEVLDYLSFDNIRGKKILLFDDVYTTGNTFKKVARKLIQLGAIEVKGFFLAKTHWLEE